MKISERGYYPFDKLKWNNQNSKLIKNGGNEMVNIMASVAKLTFIGTPFKNI